MTGKTKWIKPESAKEVETKVVADTHSDNTFNRPTVKGMMHKMFGVKE